MSWTKHQQVQTKLPCALDLPLNSWPPERSELLWLHQEFSPAFSECKVCVRGTARYTEQLLRCDALESRGHDRRGVATSSFLFSALNSDLEQIQFTFL